MPADRKNPDGTVAGPHYTPYPPTAPAFQTPAIPQRPRKSKKNVSPPATLAEFAEREPSPHAAAATASSSAGDSHQYKVARAISSCTRCRTRKQKCDGKLPACSSCERAKVECIGFDAISKTNVSRNHLHTLEQEVIQLRAQLAAYQSGNPDAIIPMSVYPLPHAESSSPSQTPRSDSQHNLNIDPGLSADIDPALRAAFSPTSSRNGRRASDFSFSGHQGDRSPSLSSAMNPKNHSLTRMVHDAALRTGHAINMTNANAAFNVSGPFGSDRGSVHSGHDGEYGHGRGSPDQIHPSLRAGAGSRSGTMLPPPGHHKPQGGSVRGKERSFAIPPLPPQPAVERLVAAYVDFIGVTAPIVHIPTLGKQLTKIREGNDVEESDVFVVMMVLALSTMASARFVDPPDELRACSEAFHAEAMKHLDAVFDEGSYVGLQAILLLIWYSLLNPEKGSIWYLVGLATRTAVDLGYHNEHNAQIEQLDALEIDMRRRLFWTAYKMDRLLSQSLGRPPSIPDGFINVPLPSGLHDVDIQHNHYGIPSGDACSYKANFVHTIKIRQLQSEILTNTYGIHGGDQVPSAEWFDDCYDRLKAWLANAPEPRGTMSAEGYAISFHNSALLLYRPSSGNPRPDRKALSTVLASSSYIIRIYRRMQLNNRISWLWMTSHFSFMAGLSFLYAFLNLHSMGGGEGVPSLEGAMQDVESCLSTLEYLSPRVPSAGACHDTMRTLSQAILEQLASPSSSTPHSETASAAASLRNLSRARTAPISSSRDDPLPNSDYLAPLPSVTLPYELSLLDNLFVNPMATHQKASDYTNGAKTRAVAAEVKITMGNMYAQQANPGVNTVNLTNGGSGNGMGGPYSLAAQVRAGHTDCPTIEQSLAGVESGQGGPSRQQQQQQQGISGSSVVYGSVGNRSAGGADNMGDLGILLGAMDNQQQESASGVQDGNQGQGQPQVGDNAQAFDIFNFNFLDEGFSQEAGLDGMALWS